MMKLTEYYTLLNIGIIVLILIQSHTIHASIFDVPIVPKYVELVLSEDWIKEQNPLCLQGFVQYCIKEETQKKITVENRYVMEPFRNDVKVSYTGRGLDEEDVYTLRRYDLHEVKSCSKNQSSIMGVYACVKSFVRKNNLNCRVATSVFKIALLSSDYYDDLSNCFSSNCSDDGADRVEIYKAFFYDGGIMSHRFLLLKNNNGYYVLDPQQCTSRSDDYCVFIHTKYFYDVPSSINYRGNVYRIDRII